MPFPSTTLRPAIVAPLLVGTVTFSLVSNVHLRVAAAGSRRRSSRSPVIHYDAVPHGGRSSKTTIPLSEGTSERPRDQRNEFNGIRVTVFLRRPIALTPSFKGRHRRDCTDHDPIDPLEENAPRAFASPLPGGRLLAALPKG